MIATYYGTQLDYKTGKPIVAFTFKNNELHKITIPYIIKKL